MRFIDRYVQHRRGEKKKERKKERKRVACYGPESLYQSGSIRLAREESVAWPGDESCPLCSVVNACRSLDKRGQPADNSEERCQ